VLLPEMKLYDLSKVKRDSHPIPALDTGVTKQAHPAAV
jgi:hypothetical protein